MKFLDEFRDEAMLKPFLEEIETLAVRLSRNASGPIKLMEFCGGHTHSIFRFGLTDLLPDSIELVHGPGCPVCVLPMGRVDDCVVLAQSPGIIFACYGDALRVPGSKMSLLQARAAGADVRIVYSPMDALKLAQANPDSQVIFFALGFETTMPSTALTVLQAKAEGVSNFSVFCNHITVIPTIKAILDSPGMSLDGFIGPGHVSMVIGTQPYAFIADQYRKPLVVTGFEPLDIIQSIWMLLRQLDEGRCEIENQYRRIVPEQGNAPALDALQQVFELRPFFEWRGLGSINHSGVRISPQFAEFDAETRFAVPNIRIADPKSCQCGEVLKGVLRPRQCKQFARGCSPQTPMGALMVSSEGACAAEYRYRGALESPVAAEGE